MEDQTKKLDRILKIFDFEGIDKEMFDAMTADLVKVVEALKKYYETQIEDTKSEISNSAREISYTINDLELRVKRLINDSEQNSQSKIKVLSQTIAREIDRIEHAIPSLPDLSVIEKRVTDVENKIPNLPEPIMLDNPDQLAEKVNTLHEKIKPEVLIGWGEMEKKINFTMGLPRDFDVRIGVSKTEVKRLTDRVAVLEASGGGGGGGSTAVGTPSGTVDGSNTVFTTGGNTPLWVFIDGVAKFATLNYTYSTGTITITDGSPPVQSIRYIY